MTRDTPSVTSPALFSLGGAGVQAELVAFGIGEHDPALPSAAPVGEQRRPKRDDPLNFLVSGPVERLQVEMEPILHALGFWYPGEQQAGVPGSRREHGALVVAGRSSSSVGQPVTSPQNRDNG
jgi:hypothetical protein